MRGARTIVLLLVVAATLTHSQIASATSELPPGGSFTDDNLLAEEGYIEAIAAIGVTRGCNPPANDRFCPDRPVTRGEMASFFARALSLPPTTENPFTDIAGSVHADTIARIAAAGITKGCNPPDNDEYCPDRIVTRGEMAAFVARAWALSGDVDPGRFTDDDGSIFEAEISRIAAAGITKGCGEERYCPTAPMARSHMAAFLARALGFSPLTVPDPPAPIGSFTTYHDACNDPCRVTNIHLIADAVDGTVVAPGETFSVNDLVGPRTEAQGYVPAPAIIGGEVYCCDHPANIGGGTSQFATTLYNAIFFAGLEDVAHSPHSIWFTRYPMGREATLGYPGPDVVFGNDTEWPVTIEVSYTRTSITVTIVGISHVIDVQSIRTGSATTAAGGTVTIQRILTYDDGHTRSEWRTHTYRPLTAATQGEGGGPTDGSGDDGGGGPIP